MIRYYAIKLKLIHTLYCKDETTNLNRLRVPIYMQKAYHVFTLFDRAYIHTNSVSPQISPLFVRSFVGFLFIFICITKLNEKNLNFGVVIRGLVPV